ncbi:MAG: LemA family protein [Rhodoferax sp.]|nr:LemA family protein [Rhodoferax sp.]
MTPDAPWPPVLAALLLFWAVGAYNRLTRCRAHVVSTFATVEQALSAYVVQGSTDPDFSSAVVPGPTSPSTGRLESGDDLLMALRHARQNPLDAQRIIALRSALERYRNSRAAWTVDVLTEHGASGVNVPVGRMPLQDRQFEDGRTEFGHAVLQHNAAIAQFPASLIAAAFGFAPAQAL